MQPPDGSAVRFGVPPLDTLDLAASVDRVAKILARAVGDVARKHGATAGQLYVVAALSRAPEGLTAKQMAAALAIRPGSLTGMLDTLQDKGVLRRERVSGDGRQQRLVLLEGARGLVAALQEVDAAVRATLQGLDGDAIGALRDLSERTEQALRARTSLPMPRPLASPPEPAAEGEPASARPEPKEGSETPTPPEPPENAAAVSAGTVRPPPRATEAPPTATPSGADRERVSGSEEAATARPETAKPETAKPETARPETARPETSRQGPPLPPPRHGPQAPAEAPRPRRGLAKLSVRVLTAVDAQLRRRRND